MKRIFEVSTLENTGSLLIFRFSCRLMTEIVRSSICLRVYLYVRNVISEVTRIDFLLYFLFSSAERDDESVYLLLSENQIEKAVSTI